MGKSKIMGWIALVVIIALIAICMTMPGLKQYWWEWFDIFFAFMAGFCYLASMYLTRMSAVAAKKLDNLAMIFSVLTVVAFIAEYILSSVLILKL